MHNKYTIRVLGVFFLVLGTLLFQSIFTSSHAEAATITVNSNADSTTNDGVCTLREAINSANDDLVSGGAVGECDAGSGTDTIGFAITPFNGSVKTIAITSQLPKLTTQMTIDGFSQDDASENTTVAPAPLNTVLRIAIDGTSITHQIPMSYSAGNCFWINADNVTIQGLNIHSCGNSAIIADTADFFTLRGSYIGTDSSGTTALPNGRDYMTSSIGFGMYAFASNNCLIGGDSPGDRNVIASNQAGDIFINNESDNPNGSGNNNIQGNFIGLASNGLDALPSGYALGLGNAILLGNTYDDLIGGVNTGEMNVIASSSEYGVAFRDGTSGTTIQGNYIGTDYTGAVAATHSLGTGNVQSGIHVGTVSNAGFTRIPNDILIGGSSAAARNIISGNDDGSGYISGVSVNDGSYGVMILNNYVGTDVTGEIAVPNGTGILMDTSVTGIEASYSNIVGGPSEGNIISGNASYGILMSGVGTYENSVFGNKIGTDKDGVSDLGNGLDGLQLVNGSTDNLIGGTTAGQGNIIAFNGSNGITIANNSTLASIISNSIFLNDDLGIKLGFGSSPTTNDMNDIDSGPNNILNTPYYTDVNEVLGDSTITYRIDVPVGSYRLEFFGNASPDPSGSGEGQEFLGFKNISSTGTGIEVKSSVLNGVTGITNLALTITEISSTSFSGFGATSEFGSVSPPIRDLSISKELLNPEDVAIGADVMYEITVTNEGLDPVDLSTMTNSTPGVNSLFIDFMPPDITFESAESGDINCFSAGAGSAITFGPLLSAHSDHELVFCGFSGSGQSLAEGDSISIIIHASVQPDSDLVFDNIVLQQPNAYDPDIAAFGVAAGSGNDIIDVLGSSVNNLAYALFPVPVEPSIHSGAPADTTNSTSLTLTGQNILFISAASIFVLLTSLVVYRLLRSTTNK